MDRRKVLSGLPTRRKFARLAKALLALGGAAFLWRLRIIQVTSFAVAAALRGQYRRCPRTRPASKFTEWSELLPPLATARAPLNSHVLVTYHPEYHSFSARRALASLRAIEDLGAGWVRADIRWRDILPDGRQRDSQALGWYRAFLRAASACGLRMMLVLSTPPESVLQQRSTAKLESWSRFVDTVASELGSDCAAYQLMNEANNPIYRFFSFEGAVTAVVRGASIIHGIDPDAKVAINVSMDVFGWRKYLVDLISFCDGSVNIIGLDHYPGTWTIGWRNRWQEVFELANRIAAAAPGTPWFKRHLMIMETGFSTNAIGRGEIEQAEYWHTLIPIVAKMKRESTTEGPILGIYELCDGDSSAWLDPEAHFGVMNSEMQPKEAFAVLKQQLSSLSHNDPVSLSMGAYVVG